MKIDADDAVERDDIAPNQRLHIIAALLAEGVHRKRADARRMGESPPLQERNRTGLEPLDQVRLDRSFG